MKRVIALFLIGMGVSFTGQAQETTDKISETSMKKMDDTTEASKDEMMKAVEFKTVSLEQTPGEFTQQELTLDAGTYVFEIANNEVGHDVGFVLAPKGKTDAEHHIKEAYVLEPVATGEKQMTGQVKLEPGEYVYFCPLNPTPEYTLIVN